MYIYIYIYALIYIYIYIGIYIDEYISCLKTIKVKTNHRGNNTID